MQTPHPRCSSDLAVTPAALVLDSSSAVAFRKITDTSVRCRICHNCGWKLAESDLLSSALAEHEEILKALGRRNPHETAQAMHDHLKKTGKTLMEALQKTTGGTFDPDWGEGVAVPDGENMDRQLQRNPL